LSAKVAARGIGRLDAAHLGAPIACRRASLGGVTTPTALTKNKILRLIAILPRIAAACCYGDAAKGLAGRFSAFEGDTHAAR
jgi:hypothetical protein